MAEIRLIRFHDAIRALTLSTDKKRGKEADMSSHSVRLAHLGSQGPQVKGGSGALVRAWAAVSGTIGAALLARRTRRLLATMDDRSLADIGVGRGDAMFEASRSMWDIDRV